MIYFCCDRGRRQQVLDMAAPGLNGIDYIEVLDGDFDTIPGLDVEALAQTLPGGSPRQRTLIVKFLRPLPATGTADELNADSLRIDGDDESPDVDVLFAERAMDTRLELVTAGLMAAEERTYFRGLPDGDRILVVRTDRAGDFSPYCLLVGVLDPGSALFEVRDDFDPRLSQVEFSFKVECVRDADCKPVHRCPPDVVREPELDYLTKDYESFRRLMLDRMSLLSPDWVERNPADLGVTLVELLAYQADRLSYEQDAIGTEAYLATCRSRISAKRHARLVDYFVSDGRNARTWVHVEVSALVSPAADGTAALPEGTQLMTRVGGEAVTIAAADAEEAADHADAVFETLEEATHLYPDHNRIPFHTWGDTECCLPAGSTMATLRGDFPDLSPGDVLLFEEVVGPRTGILGDADPAHRHAVRLVSVERGTDPVPDPVQPVTEIGWHEDDALPFPLCISSEVDVGGGGVIGDVSVARGNIVLADHGRSIEEALPVVPEADLYDPGTGGAHCAEGEPVALPIRYRPELGSAPLTHAVQYTRPAASDVADPVPDRAVYRRSSARAAYDPIAFVSDLVSERDVRPVIRLEEIPASPPPWRSRRDLLAEDDDFKAFVVETESDGTTYLRFGDDTHGMRPNAGLQLQAHYRVGNGRAGNIGADALAHIVSGINEIVAVRNPLPGVGGVDLETMEDVRRRAPVAYRTQERAVNEADYREVTERSVYGVQQAAAQYRWTGSWHTVFLTVDRLRGLAVTDDFERYVKEEVERYRMAGYDLEVDGPRFVSLELEVEVCVEPDHFRTDVRSAVEEVLSARILPDGRRGVFHPDNVTFGETVYLSRIYAAVQKVEGVASTEVRVFQRQGEPDPEPLTVGKLLLGRVEIARLENDPDHPDHGVLRLHMLGGK